MIFVSKRFPTCSLLIVAFLIILEPIATGTRDDYMQDLVTSLPGQPKVSFKHYAGYVTVNENNGRALFYWFYEAETLAEEKPLLLWLNGGPGCSSIGYGATQEIGPFFLDNYGNKGLKRNPYSWNKEANLLFLESPIGVGFSYSNTSTDYDRLGDAFAAEDAFAFLHRWFLKFPSFRTQSLYIGGESYAGIYVPELAELILDRNNAPSLFINLKGIILGNPATSSGEDWMGMVDYAWSHAVISDETYAFIKENCHFKSNNTWSDACNRGLDEVFMQYDEIDIYSLYTSKCIAEKSSIGGYVNTKSVKEIMKMRRAFKMPMRLPNGFEPCLDQYANTYYNRADVQIALHAITTNNLLLRNWTICNITLNINWADYRESVLPIYKKLIAARLRIWLYSGDTDGNVPVLSTRKCLKSLGLKITQAWRPWYHRRQVGGWVQQYEGITFATFRGAGHDVPTFKPSESLAFFSWFLAGQSPPSVRENN